MRYGRAARPGPLGGPGAAPARRAGHARRGRARRCGTRSPRWARPSAPTSCSSATPAARSWRTRRERPRAASRTRRSRAALAGDESCGIWEYAGEPYLVAVSPVILDGTVLGLGRARLPARAARARPAARDRPRRHPDARRAAAGRGLVDGRLRRRAGGGRLHRGADAAPWAHLEAERETRLARRRQGVHGDRGAARRARSCGSS